MSTQTVGSIINLVRRKVLDEDDADFTDAELLQLYNLTLFKIVTLVPSAYTRIQTILLAAGSKQEIPSDGLRIVNIFRNMGADGLTPGRGVRVTQMDILNQIMPTWATETATAAIEDWLPIMDFPEEFYVLPPNDGTGYIELEFSKTPPQTAWDSGGAWESETFPLRDHFTDPQVNGILYQAYDDDTDVPGNTPRSGLYYGRFIQGLGLQAQAEGGG